MVSSRTSRQLSFVDQVPRYAVISFVGFLCFVVLLFVLIWKADELTRLGVVDQVYYPVLVILGLLAAVVLFGVLQSSATYKGPVVGGTLNLGGAIVGGVLVVAGFYLLVPKSSTFPLTVYVHGVGGPQDRPLRNSGRVAIELGPDLRTSQIGEGGQAYFPAVPVAFRGQTVPVWVESQTYESVVSQIGQRIDGSTLQLLVRGKTLHLKLAGTVADVAGNPISGVQVELPECGLAENTDNQGRFEFQVPSSGQHIVGLIAREQG